MSIKTDGWGRYNKVEVDSNFLTGYYGRDGFAGFIKNNVNADNFLYINKEKAITLETESNTLWLEQLKGYDFNTIMRKTRANVNNENVKKSRSLDSLVITQEDEQFSESLRRTELDRWGKAYEKYNEEGISINEVIKKVKNLMKVQVSSGNDAWYCQAKQIQPEVRSG